MGFPIRQNDELQLVHPGPRVEVFREPITAGELMRKYPRHCIARPDFFEFPWIVVHPEALLVPGKVFYLVPYHTMDNLLKAKMQQKQQSHLSSRHNQTSSKIFQNSPIKSLAGVTPKHRRHDRYYTRQTYRRNVDNQVSCEDTHSDKGSSYKLEFYKSWDKVRRNVNQPQDGYDQLDLAFSRSMQCFSMMRSGRTRTEKGELLRLKPCLRKPDSVKRKINLVVRFASE